MNNCPGAAWVLQEAEREAQEHPPGTPSQDEVDAFVQMLDDCIDMGINSNLEDLGDLDLDTTLAGPDTSIGNTQATGGMSTTHMADIVKTVTGALVAPRTRQGYIR